MQLITSNRYKDGQNGVYQEFYQYVPTNKPPKRQYPLEGIYLDVSYFNDDFYLFD